MSNKTDNSGMAALSICEVLLLALNDHRILPEHEVVGILRDAVASDENAVGSADAIEVDKVVAALINHIIDGGNSVRRQ